MDEGLVDGSGCVSAAVPVSKISRLVLNSVFVMNTLV